MNDEARQARQHVLFGDVRFPVTTKWVYEHLYGSDSSFRTVCREGLEFLLAFPNLRAMNQELLQVYVNLMIFLFKHLGLNVPLYGAKDCVQVFIDRLVTWHYVFELYGKEFSTAYFKYGTNWHKPEKVISILSGVGVNLTPAQALQLIARLQGLGFK